jgi:hypothetical protein
MAINRLADYTGRSVAQCANALGMSLMLWRKGLHHRPVANWQDSQGRPLDWDFLPEPLVCPKCGEVVGHVDADGVDARVDVDPAGYSHQ